MRVTKLLYAEGGEVTGSLGSPELDAQARQSSEELLWAETSELRGPMFVDVVGPAPRLIVFGAVPIAAALCRLARATGWRPYVVRSAGSLRHSRALPRGRAGDRQLAG